MKRLCRKIKILSLLLVVSVASCDRPGKLYLNGDYDSIDAEVYIDNVKVGVLKKVSISEGDKNSISLSSRPLASSPRNYGSEAVFEVNSGRHQIVIVTAKKKQISIMIEQQGSGYLYVNSKKEKIME